MPGALATGFAMGAFAALAWPEIRPSGHADAAGALVLGAGWLASLVLGMLLSRRTARTRAPMDRLAPGLGLAGLTMPLALLAMRLAQAPRLAPSARDWLSLAACWPTGLLLGLALAAALEAARTHPRWEGRPLALPAALAGAALAGLLFVGHVAGPKLTPFNTALDLTLGCAAMGIVCVAGTPGSSRRLETWLSLLAVIAILCLPLSGVIDQNSRHWAEPAPASPTAAAPRPGPTAP
jgi:hypothetical protein